MAVQTEKVAYGGDLMIFVGNGATKTAVAFSTSAKLDLTIEVKTISSKDSGIWTEKMGGRIDWSMSTDALYSYVLSGTTSTNTYDELYSLSIARTPIGVVFAKKSGTAPDWTVDSTATTKVYTGKALISSISLSAPDNETATYTIQLEGTGELVQS